MIVYEKNNKMNISFDNEIKENPDLQIGKSGDKTEILVDGSSNSGLPEYDDTMEGAVLTLVQQPRVLIEAQTVEVNHNSGQFTHGFDTTGFIDGKTEAIATINDNERIFEWVQDAECFFYDSSPSYYIYANGAFRVAPKSGYVSGTYNISDIITTVGGELVPQWVGGNTSPVVDKLDRH